MIVVWKHLAHPNIAPLLGVTIDPIQLISDWMSSGDLIEYIANNPEADRLSLVGVSFYLVVRETHSLVSCLVLLKVSTTSIRAT